MNKLHAKCWMVAIKILCVLMHHTIILQGMMVKIFNRDELEESFKLSKEVEEATIAGQELISDLRQYFGLGESKPEVQ